MFKFRVVNQKPAAPPPTLALGLRGRRSCAAADIGSWPSRPAQLRRRRHWLLAFEAGAAAPPPTLAHLAVGLCPPEAGAAAPPPTLAHLAVGLCPPRPARLRRHRH